MTLGANMRIVIPSRSRADNIPTLRYIPYPWRADARVVVPVSQVEQYSEANPGTPIIGCPAEGIAPTRQWILENFHDKYLFFADDDAKFFIRPDMAVPRLVNIEHHISLQIEMWQDIEKAFYLGFPWVGISYRSGNNRVNTEYMDNTRSFSFWGVNADVLVAEGIRFDHTPVMEDFQVILSLLTRGYSNRVYYKWAWDQYGSNAPGGCSDWRTAGVQAEGAYKLQKLFPEFVDVVERDAKGGWFEGSTKRVDVRMKWKKAAESNSYL